MQNGSIHKLPNETAWDVERLTHAELETLYPLDIDKLFDKMSLTFGERSRFQSKTVFIKNIRSDEYRLKEPLSVYLEEVHDGNYEATCYDLDQYGTGPSEEDAIQDLCEAVVEYFELLETESSELGKNLKGHLNYLKDILERR